ncbi:MAG: glyoxalase [Pedobacter sp.]|nr:MAG: glyoxalase [Pedobacter sp.]
MEIKDSYPVFVTNDLTSSTRYFVDWFAFEVIFESSWFVLLQAQGTDRLIAFMDESHPTSPPAIPAINKQAGVFLTLEVEDAEAEFKRLSEAGLDIYYPLANEAWGQKRFGLIDPNGMYIDIVEQIAPQEGYWEKYI